MSSSGLRNAFGNIKNALSMRRPSGNKYVILDAGESSLVINKTRNWKELEENAHQMYEEVIAAINARKHATANWKAKDINFDLLIAYKSAQDNAVNSFFCTAFGPKYENDLSMRIYVDSICSQLTPPYT